MRERIKYLSGQTRDDTDQEEDWCDNHIDTSFDTSFEDDTEGMMPSAPVVMVGQHSPDPVTEIPCPPVTTMSSISAVTQTTTNSISSVAMMPSSISSVTTIPSSSSKRLPWTNSAPKYKVPEVYNLYTYGVTPHGGRHEFIAWSERWLNDQESTTFNKSSRDSQPRVVNLGGYYGVGFDHPDDKAHEAMLRVGNWSILTDPSTHQAQHVYLAKTRRAEPDLVCRSCSYFLSHKCGLSYPAMTHCSVCCTKIQAANRERDKERARWAQERQTRDT